MAVNYLPVMLSLNHPYPELEHWVAARFEVLNGRSVKIFRWDDLPKDARRVHASYMRSWLWDMVPRDTERILCMDYDIVPLRPMDELPDAPLVVVPDSQGYIERRAVEYPIIADTCYFNAGFFIARRDTQPLFEQLKTFAIDRDTRDPTDCSYEQTPFNLLAKSLDIAWLPRSYNMILASGDVTAVPDAINIHMCGIASAHARWVIMNALRSSIGLARLS